MPLPRPRLSSLLAALESFKLRKKSQPAMAIITPGRSTAANLESKRSGTITWADGNGQTTPSTLAGTITSPSSSETASPAKKRRLWGRTRKEPRESADYMTDHASRSRTLQRVNTSDGAQEPFYAHSNVSSLDSWAPVESTSAACDSGMSSCTSHEEARRVAAPAEEVLQVLLNYCPPGPQPPTDSVADMLCSIQPIVICEGQDEGKTFAERDNDVLRDYFAVRTNIVLTSACPEVAPHIVVTPVEETVDGFYVPYRNRVDYHLQNPFLLTVPWRDPIRLARKPYLEEHCYWPHPRTHDDRASTVFGIPRRVFCRSQFNHLTQVTANERLTMYHVVTALQRHRLKAVAIQACERAQNQRWRYEDEAFLETLDKPFQWNDPAEPLLKCAGYPGVVIFDSPNPFSAPHIMLCTPPQQDPWVPYATATNDPQDGGFGRYLVVPSPHVSFVNMEGSPFYDQFDSSDEDYEYESCDSPSEPASPEPMTPMELEDDDRYLSWGPTDVHDECNDEEEDDLNYVSSRIESTSEDMLWNISSKTDEIQELPARPGKPIFFFDDEEEDELPPLDDWYLSVAQRNGVLLSA